MHDFRAWVFVGLVACSGGATTGVAGGATSSGAGGAVSSGSSRSSTTTSASSGTGGAGSVPPPNNPAGCPASYTFAYEGKPCSPNGLMCWYPGAGDVGADGGPTAALLECTNMYDDGGAPAWTAAQ